MATNSEIKKRKDHFYSSIALSLGAEFAGLAIALRGVQLCGETLKEALRSVPQYCITHNLPVAQHWIGAGVLVTSFGAAGIMLASIKELRRD
jgi:hypothetical protein